MPQTEKHVVFLERISAFQEVIDSQENNQGLWSKMGKLAWGHYYNQRRIEQRPAWVMIQSKDN